MYWKLSKSLIVLNVILQEKTRCNTIEMYLIFNMKLSYREDKGVNYSIIIETVAILPIAKLK